MAVEGVRPIILIDTLTTDYIAQDGDILTGTLGANVKISIADGATVTLDSMTIDGVSSGNTLWAGITCLGDATLILRGENYVTSMCEYYPGIQAAKRQGEGEEYTLTIDGNGSLTADGGNLGAGIGTGSFSSSCGNISIFGGTVTATGGKSAAGIGAGLDNSSCGDISIAGGRGCLMGHPLFLFSDQIL